MKEQFAIYEIALKLKELGFNEECLAYYWVITTTNKLVVEFMYCGEPTVISKDITHIAAPLWQQVIDWFREKYNYHIDITFRESATNVIEGINSVYFDIEIYHLRGGDAYKVYKYSQLSDDYYYTRKEAILKAVELCQKEK